MPNFPRPPPPPPGRSGPLSNGSGARSSANSPVRFTPPPPPPSSAPSLTSHARFAAPPPPPSPTHSNPSPPASFRGPPPSMPQRSPPASSLQYAPAPRQAQPMAHLPPPPPFMGPSGGSTAPLRPSMPPPLAQHMPAPPPTYSHGPPLASAAAAAPPPPVRPPAPAHHYQAPLTPRLTPHSLAGAVVSPRGSVSGFPVSHPPPLSPTRAVGYESTSQPARARLDPRQIPRPPLFTEPQDQPPPIYYPRAALGQVGQAPLPPPPADTRFLVVDDGNASPTLMRSTVYAFPTHRGLWHQLGDVPLGVVCMPMAELGADFVPRPRQLPNGAVEDWTTPRIPLIEDPRPPPRCGQCAAYVNPFFGPDGTCNLCGSRTRGLDLTGDSMRFGTVDYAVSGPYIVRHQPVQPVQLYAIDLTCPWVFEYVEILRQLGRDMAEHYLRQKVPATPRLGVCFVSSSGMALPAGNGRYSIVGDVGEEPYCPWPLTEWTLALSSDNGRREWEDYCDRLPQDLKALKTKFKGRNAYGLDSLELSCGGAALSFLADALRESGGRGTVITWRRPNFGVGRISHREERVSSTLRQVDDVRPYTALQLHSAFKSDDDAKAAAFYKKLGQECVRNRVTLDVVYHCAPDTQGSYFDLATLGELCRVSSGKLVWITAPDWQEPLQEELTRQIQCYTGWDAIFKLRCSQGLQVKSYVCHAGAVQEGLVGSPELELSSLTPSTAIAVELDHRVGGLPKGAPHAFCQSALLYTTKTGQRRVRVSTLAIRVSQSPQECFRAMDFSATAALLLRQAARRLQADPVQDDASKASLRSKARDALYHQCVLMLASYRQAIGGMSEQLLMPANLTLLPLFCMAAMKSPLLRPGLASRIGGASQVTVRPSSDQRAFFHWHAAQATPMSAMLLVYPRIFYFKSLVDGAGEWQPGPEPQGLGSVRLPPSVPPSMEALQDDRVHLIDGGLSFYLYIGASVDHELKQRIMVGGTRLSEWHAEAGSVLWQLHAYNSTARGCESELRPTAAALQMVHQHSQSSDEPLVLDLLIEDAIGGEVDYQDFLMRLHQAVRQHHVK